jgi:hypothetical protein
LLSIIAQFVQIRVKGVFFAGHFVIVACVFIHIAGSIFIFNISKGDLRMHSGVWEIFTGAVLRLAFIAPIAYTT